MNETQMNVHQRLAAKRINEIQLATKRIQGKIDAKHPRSEDLKKRLQEYSVSMSLLEFTLEMGRPVKLKGVESENGVTVAPPSGVIKVEGKL